MPSLADFGFQVVQIEVTNRCNMRCTFCPLPIREKPFSDLPVNRVTDVLDILGRYQGIEYVAFHQFGEPLLYAGLWDCIDYCRQLGLRSQVVTNGLSLTTDNVQRLIDHPPSLLRISVQTLMPEYHRTMRGVEVSFEVYIQRVAEGLARLIEAEHGIEDIRTDLAVNEDRFVGARGLVQRVAQGLGISDSGDPTIFHQTPRVLREHLARFLQRVERQAPSFTLSVEHLDACIDRYYAAEGRQTGWEIAYELQANNMLAYKRFWNGRRIAQNHPVERALCGTNILGILVDGTVTCCCIDYEGFTGLGNIFSEELSTILERSRSILDGLQRTGQLHFDGCKRCMGSSTKVGAFIKNAMNHCRHPA